MSSSPSLSDTGPQNKVPRHDSISSSSSSGEELDFDAVPPVVAPREEPAVTLLCDVKQLDKPVNVKGLLTSYRVSKREKPSKFSDGKTTYVMRVLNADFEDDTDLATVVAFNNDSDRLETLLQGKQSAIVLFRDLLPKKPSDENFVRGIMPYDLSFTAKSSVEFLPDSAFQPPPPPTTLSALIPLRGNVKADLHLVLASNPARIEGTASDWSMRVTDGNCKTILTTAFQPHFGFGREVLVTRLLILVDDNSGRIKLFVKKPLHINPVATTTIPRKMPMNTPHLKLTRQ